MQNEKPWQDIKSAPPHIHVMIETESGYRFPAFYNPSGSLNEDSEECGCWIAAVEDFYPPCWSDGQCWESNADHMMSDQPVAWKPLTTKIEDEK